jgi:hypothetical protein
MRSNTKEVINKVQEHIKSYYENIEDFKNDMKAVQLENMSDYNAIQELVKGGSFLVYYQDVKDFLNELGINPENKEYEDQKSWELYQHLIARDGEKLI